MKVSRRTAIEELLLPENQEEHGYTKKMLDQMDNKRLSDVYNASRIMRDDDPMAYSDDGYVVGTLVEVGNRLARSVMAESDWKQEGRTLSDLKRKALSIAVLAKDFKKATEMNDYDSAMEELNNLYTTVVDMGSLLGIKNAG